MTAFEITAEEQVELDKALYDALDPLASAIRSRLSGLPEERKWEAEPVEVALSVLAAWKVVDTEVKRLTATAEALPGPMARATNSWGPYGASPGRALGRSGPKPSVARWRRGRRRTGPSNCAAERPR